MRKVLVILYFIILGSPSLWQADTGSSAAILCSCNFLSNSHPLTHSWECHTQITLIIFHAGKILNGFEMRRLYSGQFNSVWKIAILKLLDTIQQLLSFVYPSNWVTFHIFEKHETNLRGGDRPPKITLHNVEQTFVLKIAWI